MNELANVSIWSVLIAALGAIHPEAGAGAVCGGLFFWSLSPEIPISSRIWLLIASVGIGYGIGLPAARSADYSGWAWVTAGFGASMAHVIIVSLRGVVKTGSPLPPWFMAMLDALPWRRNRETRGDDQ